jgi:tight adherence protein C
METLFTAEGLQRTALLMLLFLGVVGGVYLTIAWLGPRGAARERLKSAPTGSIVADAPPGGNLRAHDSRGTWVGLMQAIEKSGVPLVDPKDPALRTRLIAAGFTRPDAPKIYSLVRLGLVIGLPLALFGWMWISDVRPAPFKLYLTGTVAALAGLYLPSLIIRAKSDRRQQQILNGFPDALDLLLVCVEAGLGLEAALDRVGMEMTRSHPLLAEQFGSVVLELRAGRSHEDALRRMADRSGSEEVRGFATLLVQSTKLGSSIAQTLRTYSSEMRERRRMRAEEKAHRLPVLLSIPLVCFMLPTMIGVLMLPAVLRVIRSLIPAMQGNL